MKTSDFEEKNMGEGLWEGRPENAVCSRCGEPVRPHWKLCPACETPIDRLRKATMVEAAVPPFVEPVTGMELVFVPAGTFMMGDSSGEGIENETPVHEVRLDGFFMGRYPVCQAQWKRVMGTDPARFKGDALPVEGITWFEAAAFAEGLTRLNGDTGVFRLPTEAEWEYAARSGGKNQMYAGSDRSGDVAWYEENSGGSTRPVGQKTANGLGLYDMSGNVWEWCRDVFLPDAYERHAAVNPECTEGGRDRAVRGGSWNLDAWSVRCTRRMGFDPEYYGAGLGFRLVLVIAKV